MRTGADLVKIFRGEIFTCQNLILILKSIKKRGKKMEMIPDEIGDLVLIDFRQVFGMEFIEDIFSEGRPDAFFGRDVSVLWEDI